MGRTARRIGRDGVAEELTEEGREDGETGADDADGLLDGGPHGGDDEGVGDVRRDDGGESCDADDGGDDDTMKEINEQ